MGQALAKNVEDEGIRKEVAEYPIVMYTKRNCGYCKMAKELLEGERLRYEEKDLDSLKASNPGGYDVVGNSQAYVNGLVYVSRRTSVPQVFVCGKFIGGYTELNKMREARLLWNAVEECSDQFGRSLPVDEL